MEPITFKTIALIFFLMATVLGLNAQTLKPSDDLYKEIVHQDSILFTAFNNRDVTAFGNQFSKDLEFYHDKGGLTDYNYTIESLKKTATLNNGLRRELVPGSIEIYPIKDYGAVQMASHTFCHLENGKQDCGTFKFIHVWKNTTDGWKITRVISIGH